GSRPAEVRKNSKRAITFLEVMALFGRARDYGCLATSPRARRQVNADAGKEEGKCHAAEHVPEIMPQKSGDWGLRIADCGGGVQPSMRFRGALLIWAVSAR